MKERKDVFVIENIIQICVMGFVQGKCPNCGGILAVNNEHDAAICQYCETPFVVEKAVQNFNIDNANISNLNISKANITLNTSENADKIAETCSRLIDEGNYSVAEPICESLLKRYPNDYRGHWLKVLIETCNFTVEPAFYNDPKQGETFIVDISDSIKKEFDAAVLLCDDGSSYEMKRMFEAYLEFYDDKKEKIKFERDKKNIHFVIFCVVVASFIGLLFALSEQGLI